MSNQTLQAMFLGTCRMHDPANILLKKDGFRIRTTPHRLHTTSQTLQFIQHVKGGGICRPEMAHLISDYASKKIFEEDWTRRQVLDDLESLKRFWSGCDAFVIEISALREHYASLDEQKMVVNNFSARDQELHKERISEEASRGVSLPVMPINFETSQPKEAQQRMIQIKRALAKPIIWVSHQRPPSDDPNYEVVNRVRLHLAQTLQTGAQSLGDLFYDPSTMAQEMGQAKFFQKEGNDLDHLTSSAANKLAELYGSMLRGLVQQPVA